MATFESLANIFQSTGVMDFLLPFLLVFVIVYAVAIKLPLFKDNKNFATVIAFVIALTFVVPHITGSYPLGYDPVDVMNQALPSISLVAVGAIMLLILMGMFGTGFAETAAPVLGFVSIAFVAYIFGAALNLWQGPYDIFGWWSTEVTELLIVLAVFGLVVYFVVRDPKNSKTPGEGMGKTLKEMFKKEW